MPSMGPADRFRGTAADDADRVLAAIRAEPGLSIRRLATRLGVNWWGAWRSVHALGELVVVTQYPAPNGPGYRWAIYLRADAP